MSDDGGVDEKVLEFNRYLSETSLDLPSEFTVLNPFRGPGGERVSAIASAFYRRYYRDHKPRRLILGSSPSRRGTAVTGVPFEDAAFLESQFGLGVKGYAVPQPSSGFIYDVVSQYGGRDRFYGDFLMGFVCPLGISRRTLSGGEVNANYYEKRSLLDSLRPFIVESIRRQLEFYVDSSVCYCVGTGGNFKFLSVLNSDERLFARIIPLEHPRFITQYNPARKTEFVDKYVRILSEVGTS